MNKDPNFDFYSFNLPRKEQDETKEQGNAKEEQAPKPFVAPTPARPLPDPDALRAMRRTYSRVGWAFFVMVVGWYIASELLYIRFPALASSWISALLSSVPLYVVGIPLLLLTMLGLPRAKAEAPHGSFGAGSFFVLLAVSFTALLGGNIMGNSLMSYLSMLTRCTFDNSVELLFDMPLWASVLMTAVLAPIFEELIFRKLMMDRLLPFGEVSAILITALLFGLMHGNFYQFFYATAIGCVFGYTYVRSGKLWPSILMHMTVNLVCGVFPSYIMTLLDYDALLELATTLTDDLTPLIEFVSQNLIGILLLLLYDFILYGLAIAGIVLLIVHRRKIRFEERPCQPARGFLAAPAIVNGGMIAALVLGCALFLLTLIVTATPMESALLFAMLR